MGEKPNRFYFDLHIHTNRYSSCSRIPPQEIIKTAWARGLHGIALTEHDRLWTPEDIEALKVESGQPQVVVLVGQEVRTRSEDRRTGDLLVFGAPETPKEIRSIDQVCQFAHQQGGVVIAPHPFAEFQGIGEEAYSARIDGIEVYNDRYRGRPEFRSAEEAWRQLNIAGIGGSDAHRVEDIGRACTEFDTPIANETDLIRAIRQGRCLPRSKPPPRSIRRMLGL